jgi:N-acyl-D-amino-acid deacylase
MIKNIPKGLNCYSLAVSFNGKLILARGYGYAKKSLAGNIPVQPQSRFRLCSMSKPLTATAVMLLIEEGKLSLDDQITSLLQDLGPQKIRDPRVNQITVRNLLEHRGGFDYYKSSDPMFLNKPPCPGDLQSFLAQRLDFTPGEKFVYSNIGYCILGRIIEKVTQKCYEDFVKARVLEPVGVRGIELGSSHKTKANEVTYYDTEPFSQRRRKSEYGEFNLEANDADGGWIGSSVDYLRFLTSIDGQRMPALLQPDTFKQMLAMPNDPALKHKPLYYAKGFWVRKLSGGSINFWHNGALPPGSSTRAARLTSGYGYVVLFNSGPDNFQKVLSEIDRALGEGMRSVKEPPGGDLFNKY